MILWWFFYFMVSAATRVAGRSRMPSFIRLVVGVGCWRALPVRPLMAV